MRVSRWGTSLAVRLPKTLVEDLGLKPGDKLEVVSATPNRLVVAEDQSRGLAVQQMRDRAWSLRYVREFAGRHNIRGLDTLEQMAVLARGFVGKRLKYVDLIAATATPVLDTGSDVF